MLARLLAGSEELASLLVVVHADQLDERHAAVGGLDRAELGILREQERGERRVAIGDRAVE